MAIRCGRAGTLQRKVPTLAEAAIARLRRAALDVGRRKVRSMCAPSVRFFQNGERSQPATAHCQEFLAALGAQLRPVGANETL
jgi:hypothetical protein